ncbi:tRNA dimethylallyltransferase [Bryobacterales bacterium F-183]|nr:tRNA dimethylallyltransferase [Bryobacterales bacterium F-183]
MHNADNPALIFVLGPTGSGKSALAVELAQRFDGEIVNCDSLQLYRGLNIGTAKITRDEQRGIPHYLLDARDPQEVFSAGDFARESRAALATIRQHGKLPIIAGGTGFYVKALTDGLFDGPPRDHELRDRLSQREASKPGILHRYLRRLDPAAAARIHSNDVQKTIRAVEVCLRSDRPMTEQFGQSEEPLTGYRFIKLGLDPARQDLYARINLRCQKMLDRGLRAEVEGLLAQGYGPQTKALESIGYKQMLDVIAGRLTESEALADIQMQTRRYAKRQLTWFRRDPEIHWLHGFGDDPAIANQAAEILRLIKS